MSISVIMKQLWAWSHKHYKIYTPKSKGTKVLVKVPRPSICQSWIRSKENISIIKEPFYLCEFKSDIYYIMSGSIISAQQMTSLLKVNIKPNDTLPANTQQQDGPESGSSDRWRQEEQRPPNWDEEAAAGLCYGREQTCPPSITATFYPEAHSYHITYTVNNLVLLL